MRRDELMKPDLVSQIVLAVAVISLFLGSTAWVMMISRF
jgi:hypothetical protein